MFFTRMRLCLPLVLIGMILAAGTSAITVAEINGSRYFPSFNGSVTNITGLYTSSGLGAWIRSTQPDDDESTSESINVFNLAFAENHKPGDILTFDATVSNDIKAWQINSDTIRLLYPRNVRVVSRDNPVEPVVMGALTSGLIGNKDMRPPTEEYSIFDNGNLFRTPQTTARISEVNPLLQPGQYGMDFWQSLLGELVTIRNVTALGRQAFDRPFVDPQRGHIWIYGNWPVTGQNSRGGLTVTDGDANPETILLFEASDHTKNPNNTKLGDTLTDITGIVDWFNGHYYLRPRTAPSIKSSWAPSLPPASGIKGNGRCDALSIATYNLGEFAPGDSRTPQIVKHIAINLSNPSILFLQGIMDDSGPTDDGTVSANLTLSGLTQALKDRTGIPYDFVNIDPVNNEDGGFPPGLNLRSAYLFNPSEVRLRWPNPGNSTDHNAVLPGPLLRFNPGRLYLPQIFRVSPKPLVAQWETTDGRGSFFTINMDWKSYWSEITALEQDIRPPGDWNNVEERNVKANATGSFIAQILRQDENAAIITAGDFHDFAFRQPLERFVQISGLQDLDVVSGVPEVERYTSTWSSQSGSQVQLDHMYVSPSIAEKVDRGDFEHVHLNTWAGEDTVVSDFDPSVARLNVCQS
ncbi:MAG: hypothetical protein HETSPECPRED_005254 [Heterodermia speciosa]|uniref:Endonuclease/exonuclease/phosphatase domain-containing protein n=1 Tax=Heterodermia speciosa TaxID=116794 RepID=A0A8H3ILA9_9LECA|nr:MAG: hypothetical protein HETSPECPRED_005254 [Heterodermia speciosa]